MTFIVIVLLCPKVIFILDERYLLPSLERINAFAFEILSPPISIGPKPSTVIVPSGDTS